jgi:hypothetical protein
MSNKTNVAIKVQSSNHRETKWELYSEKECSMEEIEMAQRKAGYDPLGYGGPYRLKIEAEGSLFKHTWTCQSSCD